jgi:chromate transporter
LLCFRFNSGPPMPSSTVRGPRNKTDLFFSLTILALQGFGGVLAVVQRELVEKKKWLTIEEFVEDWSVAQILPGPNVVNLSIMIGARHFGLSGALVGIAGMLFIPTLVVLCIAAAVANVADTTTAQGMLRGLGAVSAGVIAATGIKLFKALKNNPMQQRACLLIAAATFSSVALLKLPLVTVLLSIGPLSCLWAWHCIKKKEAA